MPKCLSELKKQTEIPTTNKVFQDSKLPPANLGSQVRNKVWFKMLDSFDNLVENWTIMSEMVRAVLNFTGKGVPSNEFFKTL